MADTDTPSARERIIATSYELFTRRGISDVGIDEVVEKAGVAKATLYRHFPSKEELVLAFLEEREQIWTAEVIDRLPRQLADDAQGQLLATFDVLDDWFHRHNDYEACSFVKVLFEMGPEGRVGRSCIEHLDTIRAIVQARAQEAGLRDAKEFAWSFNTLLKGSIVCAAQGDPEAAVRAKPIAAWLIEQHRRMPTPE